MLAPLGAILGAMVARLRARGLGLCGPSLRAMLSRLGAMLGQRPGISGLMLDHVDPS